MVQVLGFVFTAVAVVVRSAELVAQRGDWSDVHTFRWDYQALFAIPIVVFGFNCHANVVTIFSCVTLPYPTRRPVAYSVEYWCAQGRQQCMVQ